MARNSVKQHGNKHQIRLGLYLFGLGFVGIVSALPIIPRLIALQAEAPPIPVPVLQLLSSLQSSVLLIGLVVLGIVFAGKVKLSAPILVALAKGEDATPILRKIWLPSIAWGVAAGVFLFLFSVATADYLPSDFLSAGVAFAPPWYTKLLYGGITEEVMVRWGLMSLFVWLSFKLTQRSDGPVRPYNYVVGTLLSALLFGAAHLPVASILASEITTALAVYIVVGNALFGIVAGLLYWRRGLEAAILAHMTAHLALIACGRLVG